MGDGHGIPQSAGSRRWRGWAWLWWAGCCRHPVAATVPPFSPGPPGWPQCCDTQSAAPSLPVNQKKDKSDEPTEADITPIHKPQASICPTRVTYVSQHSLVHRASPWIRNLLPAYNPHCGSPHSVLGLKYGIFRR